ncbi:MAG: FG-GAP-like repeat-containing protein, partial [Candidatus Aegiribacteria sp.]|nr:FG-GAP-like repeat-containing protein [Candidatus Aegiribacteria sp.]
MRNAFRICRVGILLTLLFPCSVLIYGGVIIQTDWSGGPGVPGPEWHWLNTFSSQTQTSWTAMPGKLILGISKTSHTINSGMGGCHYTFPADMDGDGDVDVLAQSTDNYDVAWFENDGSGGGWDTHMVSDSYGVIWCAYPGDIDGDGDMDVAGANPSYLHKGVEWWRNDDGIGDSWTRFYVDDQYGSPNFV